MKTLIWFLANRWLRDFFVPKPKFDLHFDKRYINFIENFWWGIGGNYLSLIWARKRCNFGLISWRTFFNIIWITKLSNLWFFAAKLFKSTDFQNWPFLSNFCEKLSKWKITWARFATFAKDAWMAKKAINKMTDFMMLVVWFSKMNC